MNIHVQFGFTHICSFKSLGQLKPNCPGMIIGMSFTKLLFFVPIGNPRWPLQCSCVVIESSFDSGERLQAPGSLWFICPLSFVLKMKFIKVWF
jgi:hypothetical protein